MIIKADTARYLINIHLLFFFPKTLPNSHPSPWLPRISLLDDKECFREKSFGI